MTKETFKKILKATALAAVAIILLFSLIITFARDENVITWDDIFVSVGLRERIVPKEANDYIIFFDVGQGDSALIVSNGQTALIDTGEYQYSKDLYIKLRRYDADKIDFVLGSHIHSDHIGALPYLMENISIKNIMLNFKNFDKDAQGEIITQINSINKYKKINTFNPVRATVVKVGEFEITILGFYPDAIGENNRSIIAMAKINNYKFLFTGDAEEQVEKRLLDNNINIDCDVLKIAHHGSKSSSHREFISAASPKYAVISCDKENFYGHPSSEVLEILKKYDTEILRTDKNSDIAFVIKDNDLIKYTLK